MDAGIQLCFPKGLHNPKLILMWFAIAHAQQIGKLESVRISTGLIHGIDTVSHVHDLLGHYSRPIDDLLLGKLRNRENANSAMARSLHKSCIVEPEVRPTGLRALNMRQIMNREYEGRSTEQRRVIAGRKEQVVLS